MNIVSTRNLNCKLLVKWWNMDHTNPEDVFGSIFLSNQFIKINLI